MANPVWVYNCTLDFHSVINSIPLEGMQTLISSKLYKLSLLVQKFEIIRNLTCRDTLVLHVALTFGAPYRNILLWIVTALWTVWKLLSLETVPAPGIINLNCGVLPLPIFDILVYPCGYCIHSTRSFGFAVRQLQKMEGLSEKISVDLNSGRMGLPWVEDLLLFDLSWRHTLPIILA